MIKQCPSNKNSQNKHAHAMRREEGVHSITHTELDRQSCSALPHIFFKVAVLAMGTMSEICSDQYL